MLGVYGALVGLGMCCTVCTAWRRGSSVGRVGASNFFCEAGCCCVWGKGFLSCCHGQFTPSGGPPRGGAPRVPRAAGVFAALGIGERDGVVGH